MFLKEINLTNFRNYDNLNLKFDKNINIFIGNNAQGKTNILESIYFLAFTKSHRTKKEKYLIQKDKLFSKINGIINNNNIDTKYEILINENGKRVSINDHILNKTSDYLSNINVIMFSPDDLEIIKGPPSNRRYFLNSEISGFNNKYVKYLSDYNKILKTRNEYLKNNSNINKQYFDIITDKLIDLNILIYNERKKFIDNINKYINNIYNSIIQEGTIKLKYESFIDEECNNKEFIKDKFNNIFNNEILYQVTLLGIHKDDFSIYIDNEKINNYGSQGQHRLAIFCTKLAEVEIYNKILDKKPILLLDDIFSELDNTKKNNIIKYIDGDMQIFITSNELKDIDKKIIKNANIFNVKKGKITRGDING